MTETRRSRGAPVAFLAVLVLVLAAPLLPAQENPSAKPLRVLVVTGGHDHDASFYGLFEGRPNLRAVVEPHPSAFTKNLVRDFDVIALYDMVQTAQVPAVQREKLKAFAEAGKGVLVIHHALVSYQGWDWYWRELLGGRYILEDAPGVSKSDYKHDVAMTVTPVGSHPIVRGIAPFRLVDETYGHMQILPEVTVLLRSDAPTSDGTVAWVSPYARSRVVVLQLGHDHQAHKNAAFREVFHRALLWVGNRLAD